jgi:uncharacterized membrane protein YdjX (TVP38/TMEM64 family)
MKDKLLLWLHLISTLEFWETALAGFECLGPVVPILLAMIESFLPVLPLVAIVTLNVAAHGALQGFLYSWIGTVLGSSLMFLFWRHVVRHCFWRVAQRSAKMKRAQAWVNRFDRRALFVLLMLPFTPSAFVNLAFGVSDFDERKYVVTLAAAKLVMIGLLAFFGKSLVYALEEPLFLVLAAAVILVLYWLSKKITKKNHL